MNIGERTGGSLNGRHRDAISQQKRRQPITLLMLLETNIAGHHQGSAKRVRKLNYIVGKKTSSFYEDGGRWTGICRGNVNGIKQSLFF